MAAMNKTQRKELVEILERKYDKKVRQIEQDEREKAEKDAAALDKKATAAAKKIEKIMQAEVDALPEDVAEFVTPRVNSGVSSYVLGHRRAAKRIKDEYGDLREKLDDLPERLFLASVQGDDVAKIMAEFSALD